MLNFRSAPVIAGAASLALLVIGYLDLWNGGTELASAALALAYAVGIPATMVLVARDARRAAAAERSAGAAAEVSEAPPYGVAALVSAAVLALYVITLAPTTAMWDASEYIAAAKVLGVPHPPGNPFFVLLAHAFALIPFPLTYAGRVNLLAATTSALSAGCWFLVTWRSLRGIDLPSWGRLVVAASASWLGATCFTVWNQSVVNEKVYTVAMLGLATSSWAALRWLDAPRGSRERGAWFVLVAYLCGLGYANHPAGFLPIPAFGLFVLLREPKVLLNWRLIGRAAALLALGLTPFMLEPIRAAYHPAINVGEATACTGAPELACTFSSETVAKVWSNVSRDQYGGHAVADRQAPLGAQFGMWWLYFKWQFLRDLPNTMPRVQHAFAVAALLLGLFGAYTQAKRDRASFSFVAPLIFTLTPALIFYLNFRYGASQAPELGDSVNREVRDRDYFYLWSFATWGVWVALGLGALWEQWNRWCRSRNQLALAPLGAVVLLWALVPTTANARPASRAGQTFTAAWARDLLASVEPNGVLITNGDNDSFPVWYAQLVEGVRPDVSLAIVPYLNSDWFARHLISNAESIPPYAQLQSPARFEHEGLVGIIQPGFVTKDQLVVLQIIRESFPKRPIHFSIGGYANSLGLGNAVVQHGLTQRLVLPQPGADPRALRVDVEASEKLWKDFEGPAALIKQGQWTDMPSLSIPYAYLASAQALLDAYAARGAMPQATALMARLTPMAKIVIPEQKQPTGQ